MKSKVLAGISGGVDSCVAALLLKEQGFEVIGANLLLTPESGNSRQAGDARRVVDALGITLRVIDLREQFAATVINYFTGEYLRGATPNPCTVCNREIKFGALLDIALNEGIKYIATGHYAKVEKNAERWQLKKAASEKDQSYFLYMLSQNQLSHIIFPLGDMDKDATREIALHHAMPVAKKPDSQEICFVPDDDYAGFIRGCCENLPPEGDFIDEQGRVIGRHKGIVNYTIGQRKGLGAFGSPKFVTNIDPAGNTVTLGAEGSQFSSGLTAENLNWIAMDTLNTDIRAEVKIRCKAKAAPATLIPLAGGSVRVEFDEPQRSITPGQAAVFYDGDTVLGGGRIAKG